MPRPRSASPLRGERSTPRSSAPPATAATPASATARPTSGRTLAGSPGTSNRRRQRTSAISRSSVTRPGYNVHMQELRADDAARIPLPRWMTVLLAVVAVGLIPWILYLTFTLPSRHVTLHYDVAWVGFDIALTTSFAATARAA